MPQISITYTETVPIERYASRRFTVELSDQVPDSASIPTCTKALFDLAKAQVAQQVSQVRASQQVSQARAPQESQQRSLIPAPTQATQRQLNCIFAISKTLGLSKEDVEAIAGDRLSKLSAKKASDVIEALKSKQAA